MRETAARRAFATTLALSAALSFSVQPMAGRALLPTLGGSPAVWSTCLVFFQAALLAGYGWAHLLATRATPRRGLLLHGLLLAAALAWTGLAGDPVQANAAAVQSPIAWTLRALSTGWGPAFLALAATGPLVQHWYSRTGHSDAAAPYFLYAASNVGSFLGLLGYPFVIEPLLGLQAQQLAWLGGLGVAAPAILGTGWYALRRGGGTGATAGDAATTGDAPATGDAAERPPAPTATRQLRWLLLALVPSSLLLGVTAFLTTDLAAAPMLWVVPLGLYLLTWIGAFARRPWLSPEAAARGGVEGARRPLRVAMVGLGAGAMLSYRQAGDRWRVVDIDAATFDISRRHFGFWSCPDAAGAAVPTEAVVADGRLDLAGAARGPGKNGVNGVNGERFDLIALDVFSSDAVPVHLLTREAFAGYADRLLPRGVLAVHASNRYVDVVAIAAAAAGAAGLVAVARDDRRVGAEVPGVEPSRWIAIARRSVDLDALRRRRGWATPTAADRAWTDNYNDVPLRVLAAIGGGGDQ